jgi:beta-1,4-mannosyltransferase
VIPHGDFTPLMEHPERATARRQLGLSDDDTMLLFFGSVRPYKRVPELIRAFSNIHGESLQLFVAGKPLDEATRQEIEALAAPDSRIRLLLHYLSEPDLCALLSAADAAVMPYRQILGSSALLTALGYGLPVIAPAMGAFAEIIDEQCGILYDPKRQSLEGALERAAQADLPAMGVAARARAEEYPWDGMVAQTCAVYTHVLTHGADEIDPSTVTDVSPAQG